MNALRPPLACALACALLVVAPARADEAADEREENPWVEGPEPAPDDDDAPASYPPREPGAPQQDLVTPPAPRDPWIPEPKELAPPAPDARFSTTLSRAELEQFGDARLTDGLVLVPGLYLPKTFAQGQLPRVRGLPATHTQVRLDGVPIVPAHGFPSYALLGTFDTTSLERVTFRHGARTTGVGGASGAGGLLEIDTRPAAVDWGIGVPMSGRLRSALGGPDLEKGLYGAGSTGYRGVRASITAGGFDMDSPTLGREAGLLKRQEGLGGHVGLAVDVDVSPGLRVFSAWRSVRHKGTTLPALCMDPEPGEGLDCIFIEDRAFDLLMAGLDGSAGLFGFRVDARARAHAQHFGEHWQHSGSGVVFTERSFDDVWRGGGLSDVRVSTPSLLDVGGFPVAASVRAGGEVLRDRVESRYTEVSRRTTDALPRGDQLEDPLRARRVDASSATTGSLYADARLAVWRLELTTSGRVTGTRLFSPGLGERVPTPFLLDDGLALSGDVALRARVTDDLALFGALTRNQRAARLFARTLGPERFSASPRPALPLSDAALDHAAEGGLAFALPWFTVEGVTFAGVRTGPLVVGTDPLEEIAGDAPARLVRAGDRRYAGLEGRAELRAASYGVSLLATTAAVLLDDGPLLGPTEPVTGVPGPAGLVRLAWTPPAWPVGVWSRMRYALPQARLSDAEAQDPDLCPGAERGDVCFGGPGFAVFDLGATVSPADTLELSAMVENVLDAPHEMHGYPLPGTGLGARFTVTLRL